MMRALVVVLALAGAPKQETKPEEERPAVVTQIQGGFKRQGKAGWEAVGAPAADKALEWTLRDVWRADAARLSLLRLDCGMRIFLQPASEISVVRTKTLYRFSLPRGEGVFDIGCSNNLNIEETVEIDLPNGRVVVPPAHKAYVRVLCRTTKETDHVAVINGAVKVTSGEREVSIKQGEGADVKPPPTQVEARLEDVLSQIAWTRGAETKRARANLLKDGDMEEDNTAAWEAASAELTKDYRACRDGLNGLKVTTKTPSKASAWQRVAVRAGSTLRLTVWARSDAKEGCYGKIHWVRRGTEYVELDRTRPSDRSWSLLEVAVKVPEGVNQVVVELIPNIGPAYFDSVVLTEE